MLTLDAPAAIQAMPRLLEGETPAAIRAGRDEAGAGSRRAAERGGARKPGRNGAYLRGGRAPPSITAATARRGRARHARSRPRKTAARRASVSAAVADPAIEPAGAAAKRRQAHRAVTLAAGTGANPRRRNQNRIEDHNPNRRQIGRPRKPANNKTKPQ